MNEQDLKVICKIRVGSHLYGTNTESSDEDFKGVFLPSIDELILGTHLCNVPKSIHFNTNNTNTKNTKDDIDCEYYSLQYFLHLLEQGQTCAIEMLFANEENIVETSDEWRFLIEHRKDFITKKMKAFLGYARSQASKYSKKGGRLKTLESVQNVLSNELGRVMMNDSFTPMLSDVLDKIPNMPYLRTYVEPRNNAKMFEVCGRKFECDSSNINYVSSQLTKIIDHYGSRAKNTKDSNADWKAISHAFRIAFEFEEMLTTQNLKFPLEKKVFLKKIKQGEYSLDYIEDALEDLLEKLEKLSEASELKIKVNMSIYKQWLVELYKNIEKGEK